MMDLRSIFCTLIAFRLAVFLPNAQCQSKLVPITDCTCSNYLVILRCHIQAQGLHPFTLWRGTAFQDCDYIRLRPATFYARHTRFCNNNLISGYGIDIQRIDSNTVDYISELTIHMNPSFNDTSVECVFEQGSNETNFVGSTTLILSTDYPPPKNISLKDVGSNQLDFKWIRPETCSAISYHITDTNCGNCTLNDVPESDSVTCTDLDIGNICTLSVYSIVCNSIKGSEKNSLHVATQVPSAPVIFSIPTYTVEASDQRVLTSIETTIKMPLEESDVVIYVPVISYTVYYYHTNGSSKIIICNSHSIDVNSCESGMCSLMFNLQDSDCGPSTSIIVAATATNIFSEGPLSSLVEFDGVNNFVELRFSSTRLSITQSATCIFLDQDLNNEKMCTLSLSNGLNCSNHFFSETKRSTTNSINFSLHLIRTVDYCYILTATNGTLTVNERGTLNLDDALVLLLILAVVILTISTCCLAYCGCLVIFISSEWNKLRKKNLTVYELTHIRETTNGEMTTQENSSSNSTVHVTAKPKLNVELDVMNSRKETAV